MGNATTMNNGFIVLEHDLFVQAVEITIGYLIPDALAFKPGLTIMPIIQCLGEPLSNAYIETNNNQTIFFIICQKD